MTDTSTCEVTGMQADPASTTNHNHQQHQTDNHQQQQPAVVARQSNNHCEEAKSMTTALQPHQHNHRLVSLHEEVVAGVLMQPNSGQDEPQARGPVAPVSGGGGQNHEVSALARVVQSALSISALDSRAGTCLLLLITVDKT
jgi:hypothetical protein